MKTTNGKSIKKKTTILFLSIGCLTSLSLMTSQAGLIPLVNGDFSANTARASFFNDDGSIIVGAVPGWTPAGKGGWSWRDAIGDSGVDISSLSDSTTHMYLAGYDPAIYQLTTTLVEREVYALTFDLGGEWSSEGDHKTLITLYAEDGAGDVTTFGTTVIDFGDNYTMNTYTFWTLSTLDSSYGWVGVSFQNITRNDVDGSAPGWGTSYTTVDNVYLEVTPEPGTTALLTLGSLCALVAFRRRRA